MAGYTKRPDKKTIVAIVIIAVLLIAAIVGTVVFLKNRGTAEATDLASYNEQETGTTQEERPTTTDTQEQSGEPATQNAEEQETEGTEPAENPTTTEPTEVAGTEDGETTTAGGNQDTTGTGTTGNTGAGTTAGGTGTQTTGGTAGGATETANAGTTTTTDNIQETTISREETIVHPNQLVAKGEDKVWAPTELNASFASAYTNIENVQTPDITVTKTATTQSGNALVQPGETILYTITVQNNTDEKIERIYVTDAIPTGTTYVSSMGNAETFPKESENVTSLRWLVDVDANGTTTVEFSVIVNEDAGTISNVAIANGESSNETQTSIMTTSKTSVINDDSNIKVAKIGDKITYTITVKNTGEADGSTTVKDDLSQILQYVTTEGNVVVTVEGEEGTTHSFDELMGKEGDGKGILVNLPAGKTATVVFSVNVTSINGELKNVAVIGDNEEGNPEDVVDTVNITGVKENKDEDGVVKPGDTVTYEIKLSNSGTIDGTTTVVDNLPVGVDYVKSYIGNAEGGVYNPENRTVTWENVSVAKGTDTTVLKVEVKITTGVTAETQIKNTGTVEGTPIEDKDPLDTVDIRGTKTHTANLNADGTINPGTEFTYTITLTNNGTVTGTTRVTDELNSNQLEVVSTTPDKQADGTTPVKNGNSVDFGEVTVEPGIPKILTITVKVKEDATGTIENTAYINEGKPVEDPEDIPIDEFATITARKLHDEDNDDNKVKPGDEVEYTIILSNSGNVAGTTTVSDTLPKGVIYINDSIAASTTEVGEMKYDLATRTIIWEDVTVPRGTDTVTLTFRVTVDETATDTILNSAVVSGDPVEDEKPLEVVNITATKDSNIPDGTKATVGQTVTYDITATNNGTVAGNAVITDEIPTDKLGNVQIVTSTVVKGDTAVYENGVVTWNVNNLEPGTDNARTLQITATINNFEGTATTITNGVKVDNSEKPDDEEIIDVGKAEIHSTKTSTIIYCDRGETKETNIVHEGDKIRYTITVNNDGTVGKEIDISDEIKEGLSYVNGSLNVEFAGEDITETSGATVETADGKQVVKLNDYTLGTTGTLKIEFTVEVNPLADGVTSNKIDKNVATVDGVPTEDGKEYDVEKPVISTTKTSSITSCGKNQTEGTIVHEGDQITYRIEITNSGKASGDVKVQDTLPTGVIYVEGSLSAKVDNQAVSGITASGNTISGTYELEAGKTLVIEFRVTVDRLPEGEYGTTIKANNVTVNDGTPTTDKTGDYTVVKPHIKQSKESEITECAEFNQLVGNTVHEGDKIKYTIIVENDGTDSDVVTVTDVIPSGVTLDKDTLQANVTQGEEPQVNTSTVENNKTQVAVNAYKLEGGAILTITFKVTVNDLGKNVYSGTIEKNVANVNGVPTPDDSGYEVEKPQTEATKSVDKDKASYGDILTYKITVKNLSSVTAPVNISDEIPVGTEYVSNSITVNGNKVSDEGHYVVNGDEEKVVYTGELTKQDETLTLTFQVKVTEQTLGKDIVNIANVNGDEPKATTKVVKKVYSTVTSDRPIDLILVLDVSTSMDYYSRLSNMKTAAKSMIDELFPDGEQTDSTVSLITFASSAETKLTTKGYSDKDTVNNTITRLGTKSGTNINNALDEVNSLITSESDKLKNGKPVVVFLSDGAPTQPFYITGRNNNIGNWGTSNGDYSQNTETNIIEKAKSLNQKATVYSIGLGIDKLATDRGDNDAQKAALYTLCPNSDEADITVTKSYTINGETTTENKASSGDKVEYTITLTNNGNKNVNATVTDKAGDRDDITINNISNGGNSSSSWSNLEVGWNDITIPAKGTVTLTYTVTVKDGRYWDREITISTNGTEVNVPKTSCGASNCIKADDGNYYHWESEQSYARRILKDNIASSPDKYKEATDGSESTLKDIFNQIFNETQKETTTHYIEEELPATVKISETRKLDGDTVQVKIGETTKTYRISDLKNGVDGIRYIENVGFEWTVTEELATSELSLEYKVSE